MVIVKNAQVLPTEFILDHISYRSLQPSDVSALKKLCQAWFPVEYPDSWYEDITNDSKGYFTIAAIYKEAIIGAIVAEVKPAKDFNKEDADILPRSAVASSRTVYVMTLGVVKEHQAHGLGSVLMTRLINFVSHPCNHDIRVVYLHVLTTNIAAIRFYERRQFQLHVLLPGYYRIKGREFDGYTYVLYINGGKAPWCFTTKLTRLICPAMVASHYQSHDADSLRDDFPHLTTYKSSQHNFPCSLCRASSNLIKWVFG